MNLNPKEYTADDFVLVAGSTNMLQGTFDATYAGLIKCAAEAGAKILIGSAGGCDRMALDVLLDIGYKNVAVYSSRGRGVEDIPKGVSVINVDGGYKARDKVMHQLATCMIAFMSQYGSTGSGTFAGILSVVYGLDGYAMVETLRESALAPFSVSASEAAREAERVD